MIILTYPWCAAVYKALDVNDKTINIADVPKLQNTMRDGTFCDVVYDLSNHHLYSFPDILRMNNFQIQLNLSQARHVIITADVYNPQKLYTICTVS